MNYPWAQIILLALMTFGAFVSAQKHGQPRTDKVNIHGHMIGLILTVLLLGWGGFWAPLANLWR